MRPEVSRGSTEGTFCRGGARHARLPTHPPLPDVRKDVIIRYMGDLLGSVATTADLSATTFRTLSAHSRGARRPRFAAGGGTGLSRAVRSAQAADVPSERVQPDWTSIPLAVATEHPIPPIALESSHPPASGPPPLPRSSALLPLLRSPGAGSGYFPCPDLYHSLLFARPPTSTDKPHGPVRGASGPRALGNLPTVRCAQSSKAGHWVDGHQPTPTSRPPHLPRCRLRALVSLPQQRTGGRS